MGFLDKIRRRYRNAATATAEDSRFSVWLAGKGYVLGPEKALQVAAVFRCVDIITKTMGTLPIHLMKRVGEGGRERAENHPVYPLVYILPNPQTTAYEFKQMYVANLLLCRAAFAVIRRDRNGFIRELWNVPTANVAGPYINNVTGERYIVVSDDQFNETLYEGDFLYTPGFLLNDRQTALEPLAIAAEVLGLTNSLAQYASSSVNGTSPGGFIEHPGAMSDKAFARFKEDFNQNYAGAVNSGKWLFLEEGAKANMFSRDMEKAQVLESRKMQVTEIARIFGVPPHLVMDLEHATFSNIEQQSAEYVRDCINPLSVRLEQSMYRDLLTARERKIYYFKTNTNALLRGDTQTRAQYYNTMRQNGVMSTNDIRELEDMKPSTEPGADLLLVNGNMITLANAAANLPKGAQAKLKEGIR